MTINENKIAMKLIKIALVVFYGVASISVIGHFITMLQAFKELTSYYLTIISVKAFTSFGLMLILFKALDVIDLEWATVVLPIWPIFYIYFGCMTLIVCHFLIKVPGAICAKIIKKSESECQKLFSFDFLGGIFSFFSFFPLFFPSFCEFFLDEFVLIFCLTLR